MQAERKRERDTRRKERKKSLSTILTKGDENL